MKYCSEFGLDSWEEGELVGQVEALHLILGLE